MCSRVWFVTDRRISQEYPQVQIHRALKERCADEDVEFRYLLMDQIVLTISEGQLVGPPNKQRGVEFVKVVRSEAVSSDGRDPCDSRLTLFLILVFLVLVKLLALSAQSEARQIWQLSQINTVSVRCILLRLGAAVPLFRAQLFFVYVMVQGFIKPI